MTWETFEKYSMIGVKVVMAPFLILSFLCFLNVSLDVGKEVLTKKKRKKVEIIKTEPKLTYGKTTNGH